MCIAFRIVLRIQGSAFQVAKGGQLSERVRYGVAPPLLWHRQVERPLAALDGAARGAGACVRGRRYLRVGHAVHLLHPEGAAVLVLAAEGASLLDGAHVGGYLVGEALAKLDESDDAVGELVGGRLGVSDFARRILTSRSSIAEPRERTWRRYASTQNETTS